MPCHKFGYYTTTSGVSTVITHTASSMGAQGSALQAQSYPQAADAYCQTHSQPLSYPAATSDLVHRALPVTAAHQFMVPEQVAASAVRGKHKQKAGGLRTASAAAVLSGPSTTAPTATSCLAKLLSSSAPECKSSQTLVQQLGMK